MVEPLSAIAIATFICETAAGAVVGKLTEAALKKANELRQKIWAKFKGNASAEKALKAAENGSQSDLQEVAKYLEAAMAQDKTFEQEVQQIVGEIKNLTQVDGENFNVFGGEVNYSKQNNSPVIQGGSGHTITFNIGTPSQG